MNFTQLKNACIQRGTLLPSDFKQQIKEAVNLDDFLDALDNPMYCNWLNICLLKRIVKTVDIPEAKLLIQAYEKSVYSRKVSDVKIYFHSDYFNPSHVSLVNAKILRSFKSLTVADIIKYCQELECNMGVYAGSVTVTEYINNFGINHANLNELTSGTVWWFFNAKTLFSRLTEFAN